MNKLVVAVAVAVAALATTLPGAFAREAATPGVTSKTVTIGATFPLSGVGATYAPISTGMKAYFAYINARRDRQGRRGVYGRQIRFIVYDDQYPSNIPLSVQLTRRLVEQDKVFATVGALGTEPQQAVRDYMLARKVPQLFVSTGATLFGAQHSKYKWTIGWQPDYDSEGRAYGQYVRKRQPNARVAILYSNDDFGKTYLRGFERGLGGARARIVAREGFEAGSNVSSNVVRLSRSGANAFLILGIPSPTVTALVTAYRLGWRPQLYVNSVSALDTVFQLTIRSAGSPDVVRGAVTTGYLKNPANPKYAKDKAMQRYRRLLARYGGSGLNPNNALYLYGMAKAETFVQTLYRAGKNPTRESLRRAAENIKMKTPWLIKGIAIASSKRSPFPISNVKLARWNGTYFQEFGSLIKTR